MNLNEKYHTNIFHFYVFLDKNLSDVHNSDKFSRWWPDWYGYKTCHDTGQIIYGDRVLFAPSQLPNQDKYIKWATEINLGDPERISGPFNFEEISTTNPTRAKVKS